MMCLILMKFFIVFTAQHDVKRTLNLKVTYFACMQFEFETPVIEYFNAVVL
jgi:hypothetical protein